MNIFCANCENECSESATACPKCGHQIGTPTFRAIYAVVWKVIAAVLLVLTQLAIAVGATVGAFMLFTSLVRRV